MPCDGFASASYFTASSLKLEKGSLIGRRTSYVSSEVETLLASTEEFHCLFNLVTRCGATELRSVQILPLGLLVFILKVQLEGKKQSQLLKKLKHPTQLHDRRITLSPALTPKVEGRGWIRARYLPCAYTKSFGTLVVTIKLVSKNSKYTNNSQPVCLPPT